MASHDFRIAWCHEDDAAFLLQLEATSLHPWTAQEIAEEHQRPRTYAIALRQTSCFAGYGLFHWQKPSDADCGDAYPILTIRRLVIHPAFRRRHMAMWLIEAAERQLIRHTVSTTGESKGHINTHALVPDDLLEVHLFLKKNQFVACHIQRDDDCDLYFFKRTSSWERHSWGTKINPVTMALTVGTQPPRQQRSHD